jgi:hypothetical protein
MARIDTRNHRTGSDDRAHWRAGADTWHALLGAVVVMGVVIPALFIGALMLIEAVFSRAQPAPAERAQMRPVPPSWRPNAPPRMQFSIACIHFELDLCARD